MVAATNAAFKLHHFNQTLLVSENKIHQRFSPSWLIHHLHQEVIISVLEEPRGLWLDGWLAQPVGLPANIRVVKIPYNNQGR